MADQKISDIDPKTAREIIQAHNAALKNIGQYLKSLSSDTVHDFKAPLRHITIYAEMLEAEHANAMDGTAREYLGAISEAAKRMRDQIDDFARFMNAAPSGINLTKTSIDQIISPIVESMEDKCALSGASVQALSVYSINTDPILLKTALTDLIEFLYDLSGQQGRQSFPVIIKIKPEDSTLKITMTRTAALPTHMKQDDAWDLFHDPKELKAALSRHILGMLSGKCEISLKDSDLSLHITLPLSGS